jgi:tRNA dimethylallyltransferase
VAVIGATAAGKSELSLRLAQALDGEVISADSMQLYRGMDIGTGKLTPDERRGVPHHLLDVWDVTEPASVSEYQRLARAAIQDIVGRGRTPILTGGSGLYVRAVIDDLEFPGTDPGVRARLDSELERVGAASLHARLADVDPAAAAAILPGNGRRIVRALEVVELSGRPFSATLPRYQAVRPTIQLGLELPRPLLDQRIEARVGQMWQAGLVGEVRGLVDAGLREGRTASRALGYTQVLRCIDGGCTEAEARAETVLATRRFARRQESWFRRDPRVAWLPAAEPVETGVALATIEASGAGCEGNAGLECLSGDDRVRRACSYLTGVKYGELSSMTSLVGQRSTSMKPRGITWIAVLPLVVGGLAGSRMASAQAAPDGHPRGRLVTVGCSAKALAKAVARGGTIQIHCREINLAAELVIAAKDHVTIKGNGAELYFAGPVSASSRVFLVERGGQLTVSHAMIESRVTGGLGREGKTPKNGADGGTSEPGGPGGNAGPAGNGGVAEGGALLIAAGAKATLENVTMKGDTATGGTGGDGAFGGQGGNGGDGPDNSNGPGGGGGKGGGGGDGGDGGLGAGGCVYNAGTLTITHSALAYCEAAGGYGGAGESGGLGGAGGTGGSESSDTSSATGGRGGTGGAGGNGGLAGKGGAAEGGAIYNSGRAVISHTTFTGDEAQGGYGGNAGYGGAGGDGGGGGTGGDNASGSGGAGGRGGAAGNGGNGADGGLAGPAYGGAIFNAGSLTYTKVTFSGTVAAGAVRGYGGGGGYGGDGTADEPAGGSGGDGGSGQKGDPGMGGDGGDTGYQERAVPTDQARRASRAGSATKARGARRVPAPAGWAVTAAMAGAAVPAAPRSRPPRATRSTRPGTVVLARPDSGPFWPEPPGR